MEIKKPESLAEAILQCLAYADIFDQALTSQEMTRYLVGHSASGKEVNQEAERLQALREGVGSNGEFFFLRGREKLAEIRLQRERNSREVWRQARRYGHWIANLPFVRMVAVTGSLATIHFSI